MNTLLKGFKAVIVGDIHVADNPPTSRTDTYREDILDKLRWIVEYSNDYEPDALLLLGDVFHIKRPDRNSHRLVQQVATILGNSKYPVQIVPGNHDMTNDVYSSLDRQPLGTLALHPNIDILTGPSEEFPLFGFPYVDPSAENMETWLGKYRDCGGNDEYPMILTHQAIFPEKEEPIYDHITAESWADQFASAYTAYGHIHSRMKAGPWYKINGTVFLNNGAISRGSLHEETINRKLAITTFDGDKQEDDFGFTSVPIPFRPPEEVFRFGEFAVIEETNSKVDAFLHSLGSLELSYLTAEGIMSEAMSSTLPKPALQELEEIIENVVSK